MYKLKFFKNIKQLTNYLNKKMITQDRIVFINRESDKLFDYQLIYLEKEPIIE